MLISPLQNSGVFQGVWLQKRPYITQDFAKNPNIYKQFGLKGHNGLDMRCKEGTPVFACMDGIVRYEDSGKAGYGLHVKHRNAEKELEAVYAHLSRVTINNDASVSVGDLIGYSGNTGFSTAAHLHWGVRMLNSRKANVWNWGIKDGNNGYAGYFDPSDFTIAWKGSLVKNNL